MRAWQTQAAFWLVMAFWVGEIVAKRELIDQQVVRGRQDGDYYDYVFDDDGMLLAPLHESVQGSQKELKICECASASGSPNGLSCEKEGWFISNFEQAGQWSNGGGWVPLSRAICCRPCLPEEIPGSEEPNAVAIISTGCHPSSNSGPSILKCEATGGSFITGWSEATRIPDARQYYYPEGAVQCCTPSLLLENGDARPLERCNCVDEDNVNCGGTDTHRLLSGYARWGGDRTLSCFDLNFCSGHGSCNLGTCNCVAGFGGADCSHRVQMDPGGLTQWAIAMIVLSSVAVALLLLIIVIRVGQYCAEENVGEEEAGTENGDDLREPLIPGLASDDEGSVGSEDSSICEEDDHMPPPISRRHPPVEEAVGGGVPVTPEEQSASQPMTEQDSIMQPNSAPLETSQLQAETAPNATNTPVNPSEPQVTPAPRLSTDQAQGTQLSMETGDDNEDEAGDEEALNAARVQADQAVIQDIRQAQQAANASECHQDGEKKVKEEKDRGGLPGIFCTVCLTRPVQVAVVPCGHMCMCRRCSRRLLTCPVCRVKVLRRQRIFLGG